MHTRGLLYEGPNLSIFPFIKNNEFHPQGCECHAFLNNAGINFLFGEFDSGSERTLAAWIRHASRTEILNSLLIKILVADGLVTRENLPFRQE